MRSIQLLVLFLIATIQLSAQSVSKTMLRLPDTGQKQSYTNTFGEDNDFNINTPFFLLHGNGTVTDTVTSLMWQQTDGGEMTWDKAIAYCDTLTLGGYRDWRLPNAHESFSILNHQYTNPALDPAVFAKTGAEYWWTSTAQPNDNTKAWATNAGGGIGNHPKAETISAGGPKKFHVRAVRDVKSPEVLNDHFIANAAGTITDQLTILEWQKSPFKDTLTWEQALLYADTLTYGGFSDWRLPNIKELQSINDESRVNPSLNPTFFTAGGAKIYWSSTTLPNQTAKAWYLNTQYGITSYDAKTRGRYVLCVRSADVKATAVTAVEANAIVVYPNPFNCEIHLRGLDANTPCKLLNFMGKELYSGTSIAAQDFSALPSGYYFLEIGSSKKTYLRLLKE